MSSYLQQDTSAESVRSSQTSLSTLHLPVSSASETGFHFFVSDSSLGAIRKEASACDTAELFFEAALASFKITCQQGEEPVVAAVKVSWRRATWPMVVRWKDAEGFKVMMSTIRGTATAGAGTSGGAEVEVSCILQR